MVVCATVTVRRVRSAGSTVVSGALAGVTGAALFAIIHSLLIFPVWARFLGHLPFALGAGVGLALAYDEAAFAAPCWRSPVGGARFGLITFLALAPATLFSNGLRAIGAFGGANGPVGVAGTLVLAVVSGATGGWLVTRRSRGAYAFGAATLALTTAMGGTIPIVNSVRATWMFAGFLPICVGSGVALSVARGCLTPQERA